MIGGCRLLLTLVCGFLLAAVVVAQDLSAAANPAPLTPPKAKMQPVTDELYGHKIVDNYRWLEDAGSPETQEFVRQELAYARAILDPLPGRDKILDRLQQLALVGTIGAPQLGGKYYFYTRREGTQN